MADEADNPMKPSSDHEAMCGYWRMIDAILGGAEAMRATVGGRTSISGPAVPAETFAQLNRRAIVSESPYLPKFPNEEPIDYELRRRYAPLTNIYADLSRNLAAKPFSKTLDIDESSPEQYKKLAENIDGQGNNLHVFASEVFKAGLDYAIDWILVDYATVPQGATLADERGMGARPYWVRIPAERMLAVYSDFLNGQEIKVHARIYEPSVQRDGYEETCVERVRIFNREPLFEIGNGEITTKVVGYQPATWEIYELLISKDASGKEDRVWVRVAGGPVTIGTIPLVPYIPGKRQGTTWKVEPELRDLAYLQVEEFQQESNLKTIKEMTAFPMIAVLGMPPRDPTAGKPTIDVGPRAAILVEFGPDGKLPDVKSIEPSATSLTFLETSLNGLRTEMRDLGMQPLATANLTVITTANVSMKAHSAVQAWAIRFKDALEQAWTLTAKWLNATDKIEVKVHTDFGVDFEAGTELDSLLKAEGQAVLSKRTVQEEFKRRGVLSDEFDPDEEEQRLAEEQQGQQLQPEKMIDPVTGQPLVVTPQPGIPNPPPQPPKPSIN